MLVGGSGRGWVGVGGGGREPNVKQTVSSCAHFVSTSHAVTGSSSSFFTTFLLPCIFVNRDSGNKARPKYVTSLIPRPYPLTRKNSPMNQVKLLGLAGVCFCNGVT